MTIIFTRTEEPKVWRFTEVTRIDEYSRDEIRVYIRSMPHTPTFIKKNTIISTGIEVNNDNYGRLQQ